MTGDVNPDGKPLPEPCSSPTAAAKNTAAAVSSDLCEVREHAESTGVPVVFSTRRATPGSVSTMLDRRFIRDNPEAVKAAVRVKGIDLDVDELLSLDRSSRELQRELDEAQTRRKAFSREFANADEETRAKLKADHEEQDQHLRDVRDRLARVNEDLQALLSTATEFQGPGILIPTRNAGLFRWCLESGLRVTQVMTLMTVGLYNEPAGAYLPSILF